MVCRYYLFKRGFALALSFKSYSQYKSPNRIKSIFLEFNLDINVLAVHWIGTTLLLLLLLPIVVVVIVGITRSTAIVIALLVGAVCCKISKLIQKDNTFFYKYIMKTLRI